MSEQRKMWFGYERDFKREWCPVVRFGSLDIGGKAYESSAFHEITDPDFIDECGEPRFALLQKFYPKPEV